MTQNSIGLWHTCTWSGSVVPASPTGTLALGFVSSGVYTIDGQVSIGGISGITFTMIDLTETAASPDPDITYRGGIQSVDKGFSSSPILIPIPTEFPVGFDIGFVDSATITIAGVWFDGLLGRDLLMEDLRTSKKIVASEHQQSPLVFVMSNRAYPVFITGYSSNIVGGQGNIVSFRLGLAISAFKGHYGYTE